MDGANDAPDSPLASDVTQNNHYNDIGLQYYRLANTLSHTNILLDRISLKLDNQTARVVEKTHNANSILSKILMHIDYIETAVVMGIILYMFDYAGKCSYKK